MAIQLFRGVRPFVSHCLLLVLVGTAVGTSTALAQNSPVLSVDTQFPVAGSNLHLDLKGAPGAAFFLHGAAGPAESYTAAGKSFLDPSSMFDIAQGVLSPAGDFSLSLKVPTDPALRGSLFFFQAGTKLGTFKALSNAIVIRIESATPAGARQPAAIAVSPNGQRAYVVHGRDASVSVLDPVRNALIRDMPVGRKPTTLDRPIQIAVDPQSRHAFVVNPAQPHVTVIHTATDSIAAQVPVPLSCSAIAFKFDAVSDRVLIASARDQAVLVFTEIPHGTFTQTGTLPLQGNLPAVLAVLPNGLLMVGQHNTLEIEVIDPEDTDGDPLVTRIPLGSRPLDIAIQGNTAYVTTFTPGTVVGTDGVNEVLLFDATSFTFLGRIFRNFGTDYFGVAVSPEHLVVTGTGSGSLVIADPGSLGFASIVELVPDEPAPAVPFDVALVPPPGGGVPDRAYVIDRFRETVRPVQLAGGPPFKTQPEIALAHSGLPRHPMTDFSHVERGEFLFWSVLFFNGSPQVPNPVTCNTCHPGLLSDSITTARVRQCQPLFAISKLAPFGWKGDVVDLPAFTQVAFNTHGKVGGLVRPKALAELALFQASVTESPVSPFRNPDGSISAAAQRGEAIFNGVAQCSVCHVAPLFIPAPPDPPTIAGGVGTDLVPANVATLLGLWATAPYLHDGSAATLLDVLKNNVGDKHGTTSTLDAQQQSDLVEFLKTL